MGYLEGLLGGFTGRKREYEAEELRKAELANEREARVYEALINSPDPEIQALATAGLLESARGPQKKSGIRGWIGQMEQSPFLGRIQELINTPVTTTEEVPGTPTLPSRSMIGAVPTPGTPPSAMLLPSRPITAIGTPPDATEPAAQPTTSPTEGTPLQPLTTIEQPSRPTPGTTRQVTKPRQVFLTPEEAQLRQKRAAARGDVEGEIEGLATSLIAAGVEPGEARRRAAEEVMKRYQRSYGGGSPYQSVEGEALDENGNWYQTRATFDKTTGVYRDLQGNVLREFRSRQKTGSTGMTPAAIAMQELFPGRRLEELTPEEVTRLQDRITELGGERAAATTTGRNLANETKPLTPKERVDQETKFADEWQKALEGRDAIRESLGMMEAGLERVDADPIGGSQAVLVTFQKILDRNSVVRESEYARSKDGLSALDWLQGQYDRYKSGGVGVPKTVLEEMVKTARLLASSRDGSTTPPRSPATTWMSRRSSALTRICRCSRRWAARQPERRHPQARRSHPLPARPHRPRVPHP